MCKDTRRNQSKRVPDVQITCHVHVGLDIEVPFVSDKTVQAPLVYVV